MLIKVGFRITTMVVLSVISVGLYSSDFATVADCVNQCGLTRLTFCKGESSGVTEIFVESIFGSSVISEPVLIELFCHPQFIRMKKIHQHGHWGYLNREDTYTRYEHSINVFMLVRLHDGSLEEQISALLHDISHTVFSHVGARYFSDNAQIADLYQDDHHEGFLKKYGIDKVLERNGFSVDLVHHKNKKFTILEQSLPSICADRFEYNITGGIYKGLITHAEAKKLVSSVRYKDGQWFFVSAEAARKFARLSLYMTERLWGGVVNMVTAQWLALALRRAVDLKLISEDIIIDGVDDEVWNILESSKDAYISAYFNQILHYDTYFECDESSYNTVFYGKFRGIDPYVLLSDGIMKKLSEIDPVFCAEYLLLRKRMEHGWMVRFKNGCCWQ